MNTEHNLSWKFLNATSLVYGDSYYLLDMQRFVSNYHEFINAFRKIYPNTHLGYSFKTNYTPAICRQAYDLGAYAEVVSEMEFDLARSLSIPVGKIIFNGPYKKAETIERVLLGKGMLYLDCMREFYMVEEISKRHKSKNLTVGLRCNFDIGEHLNSRFGLDIASDEFRSLIQKIEDLPNMKIKGIHCHFPNRNIESFIQRVERMLLISRNYFNDDLDCINIGGGFFGKMSDSLKDQFGCHVPSYCEYATEIASRIDKHFLNISKEVKPMLILEPGSALVADTMEFVSRVISVKKIGERNIATISGSAFNITPTSRSTNLPLKLLKRRPLASPVTEDEKFDVAGYTCIETDYVYKGFNGKIEEDDYMIFGNVGSYSVVMKPPFILPNVAILELDTETRKLKVLKRAETPDDIFATFVR